MLNRTYTIERDELQKDYQKYLRLNTPGPMSAVSKRFTAIMEQAQHDMKQAAEQMLQAYTRTLAWESDQSTARGTDDRIAWTPVPAPWCGERSK